MQGATIVVLYNEPRPSEGKPRMNAVTAGVLHGE